MNGSEADTRRAGAHLWIGIAGTEVDAVTRRHLERIRPGAVVLFQRNIESPSQVQALVAALRVTHRGDEILRTVDVESFGAADRRRESVADIVDGAVSLTESHTDSRADVVVCLDDDCHVFVCRARLIQVMTSLPVHRFRKRLQFLAPYILQNFAESTGGPIAGFTFSAKSEACEAAIRILDNKLSRNQFPLEGFESLLEVRVPSRGLVEGQDVDIEKQVVPEKRVLDLQKQRANPKMTRA